MAIERRVRIVRDSEALDPRKEYDGHSSRMICWHRRYNLGDEHSYDSDDFLKELACEADAETEKRIDYLENGYYNSVYEHAKTIDIEDCHGFAAGKVNGQVNALIEIVVRNNFVMLPLYLYDHSGITMSTGSFDCKWDSGQVGWIICDKKTIDAHFDGDRDKAEDALRADVKVYDQYLTGDVYGYVVEERDTVDCPCCDRPFEWAQTASCWGFYGDNVRENGMADHLSDDLIVLAENADIEYPAD